MINLILDTMLFFCISAFVTGIVIAGASLL